jgi:hypothetical protein
MSPVKKTSKSKKVSFGDISIFFQLADTKESLNIKKYKSHSQITLFMRTASSLTGLIHHHFTN